MPHTRSAKKRVRQYARHRMRNRSVKSFLKTRIKKFDAAVGAGNLEEAKKQGLLVQKSFDKAVTHGIVHKNRASRIKANVMRKVNRLAGTPAKG